jgi:Flp pilus assembly pilin Flp
MLVLVEYYLSKAGIRLVNEENGQGLIEYVLIAALISIFAVVAITAVGPLVDAQFDAVGAAIP